MGLALAVPALSSVSAEEAAPAVTADADADADADAEISDEEALEDDILLVIDLPIVVADARDDGVDEEELDQFLTTAKDTGLSAGTTAEIVLAETETTKAKGKRKGLHHFIRKQLAAGVPPKEIAKKIRDREEVLEEMTPEERAALEKRIAELRDLNHRRRKAHAAKRKALVAKGQVIKLLAHEAHKKRKVELAKRKVELAKAREEHRAAHGDRKEAREDHEEAKEALKTAHKEAKKDHKEAKKDHKEAKKGHKKGGRPGAPGGKKKGKG